MNQGPRRALAPRPSMIYWGSINVNNKFCWRAPRGSILSPSAMSFRKRQYIVLTTTWSWSTTNSRNAKNWTQRTCPSQHWYRHDNSTAHQPTVIIHIYLIFTNYSNLSNTAFQGVQQDLFVGYHFPPPALGVHGPPLLTSVNSSMECTQHISVYSIYSTVTLRKLTCAYTIFYRFMFPLS
jgi:hypothetical protein